MPAAVRIGSELISKRWIRPTVRVHGGQHGRFQGRPQRPLNPLTVGNRNSAENQNPFFSQVCHFDQSHYCGQRMIRPVREGGHGLVSNRQVFDVQTLTTALLLDPHVSGRTYKVRPSPCLDAHELGRQLRAVWEHLSACRLCLKGGLVILGIALN
jgi:hypothetical protein